MGSMDLLSERINLVEPWMVEEIGTWGAIYDTDLDRGESDEYD